MTLASRSDKRPGVLIASRSRGADAGRVCCRRCRCRRCGGCDNPRTGSALVLVVVADDVEDTAVGVVGAIARLALDARRG